MISRRAFLAAPLVSVPAAAWLGLRSSVKLGCQTNAWQIDPQDFSQVLGVLAQLKELGFDGFETGFRNLQGQFGNATIARKQIEKTGLQFFGVHIFLNEYDPQTRIAPLELIKSVAKGAVGLGAQRVIVSGKGVFNGDQVSTAVLSQKIHGLLDAADYCRSLGLGLAYHNHAPEFASGGFELAQIMEATKRRQVDFLIDCGWAFRAQINVPEFFARYHKRIVGLHLRDFKGAEQVPLGQGEFPLRALAEAIQRVKWAGWVLNEEERLSGEKLGEKAVAPARATLRQVFGR